MWLCCNCALGPESWREHVLSFFEVYVSLPRKARSGCYAGTHARNKEVEYGIGKGNERVESLDMAKTAK